MSTLAHLQQLKACLSYGLRQSRRTEGVHICRSAIEDKAAYWNLTQVEAYELFAVAKGVVWLGYFYPAGVLTLLLR